MSEEDCGICGLEINDKFSYTLDCGHAFHYECLMKTFNSVSYNKKCSNICPYCRKHSEYLPLVNGLKKVVPGVHCNILGHEIEYKNKLLKEKYSQKCGYTITKGKNKGNACGKNCMLGYGYCKTHLEKMKSKHGELVIDLALPTSNDKQPDPQNIMNV